MNALLQDMGDFPVPDVQSGSRRRMRSVRWPEMVHDTESIFYENSLPADHLSTARDRTKQTKSFARIGS